jgi:hypothetical protein
MQVPENMTLTLGSRTELVLGKTFLKADGFLCSGYFTDLAAVGSAPGPRFGSSWRRKNSIISPTMSMTALTTVTMNAMPVNKANQPKN